MNMSELIVVARVVAKNELVEDVRSELLKLIEPTRVEEGCISYDLHRDNDNPAVFVFYEVWENAESLEKHMNTPHFKEFAAVIGGLAEEIGISKLTRLT